MPAIISGIAEPIIALSDTHFAGHIGPHDLAAVGIGSSFFLLVLWVLAQTRSAVLAVVARYYGEGRLDDVRDLVPIATWMNVGLGLLFYAVTVPFAGHIFALYNPDPIVLEKAVDFFRLRAIGFPIALSVFAMTGAFRGIQNMRWSMWISVIGASVNLALNPILIFGWGPIHAMGINGSAIASVIAQSCMCVVAVYVMLTRTPFSLFPTGLYHSELLPLLRNSGNLFARTIALNACYFFGNRFASGFGVAYIGAHSIAMQIWLFSAFFIDGYAAAGSVIAGRLNGERDWTQLHRVSWQVVRVTVFIAAGLSVLYIVGHSHIGSWFTHDPEVLGLFNSVFWMVILTQPINAVAFAWDGIYKGIAASAALRNALIVATFGVFIPTVYICASFGWKLHGVWLAFLLWMIMRAVWLTIAFERKFSPMRHRS
ncbi:MAG: MATE family efflux transporter [Flavobacteriales bacterium]|nr:MATE family efflux transporter [Flavobacteriales bacterium]